MIIHPVSPNPSLIYNDIPIQLGIISTPDSSAEIHIVLRVNFPYLKAAGGGGTRKRQVVVFKGSPKIHCGVITESPSSGFTG
jgi:hypothetical protein